jgi:hypothetical protein
MAAVPRRKLATELDERYQTAEVMSICQFDSAAVGAMPVVSWQRYSKSSSPSVEFLGGIGRASGVVSPSTAIAQKCCDGSRQSA